MARMLNAIQQLAIDALIRVTPAEARAVFVEERPAVIAPLPDPASRPRGREHPLMTLIKLGLSGARLLVRVLKLEAEEPGSSGEVDLAGMEDFVGKLKNVARNLGIDPDAA
jgi:hypothetical protein